MIDPKQGPKQTLGQYRVGISFNPSGLNKVDTIKQKAAELIDLINDIEMTGLNGAEVARLKALVMTHAEDAAMWAVKAVTKPDRI